jgi:Ser/Thr protein kinase RdoA (MazF antagonist)
MEPSGDDGGFATYHSLEVLVRESYGLTHPLQVSLLRAGSNHTYLVQSANGRFVLRQYGRTWRSPADIHYEIDLHDANRT